MNQMNLEIDPKWNFLLSFINIMNKLFYICIVFRLCLVKKINNCGLFLLLFICLFIYI